MADVGKRFTKLAETLGLSKREKAWAEAYAIGPTAGNGTGSARVSGYTGSDKALSVAAARLIGRDRVRRYLVELTGAAVARSEQKTERRISDLAESLEFLTTVQRSRLGDYLTDKGEVDVTSLRAAPAGLVRRYGRKVTRRLVLGGEGTEAASIEDEHVQFELESAQQAAKTLVEYHTGAKAPQAPQATVNVLAVLGDLPLETLRQLKGAFARAIPENGNGQG